MFAEPTLADRADGLLNKFDPAEPLAQRLVQPQWIITCHHAHGCTGCFIGEEVSSSPPIACFIQHVHP
eukprot:432476-Amphidinium_carterae.1